MDFNHTADRQMLSDTLRRFIADRYPIERRNRVAYAAPGYDVDIWLEFAGLGAIGALFSPDDGGYGGEAADLMVVFEALGAGVVVEPFLAALLSGRALARAGGHGDLLGKILEGEAIVAFAHQEPRSRYDLAHVETRARQTATGFVLQGAKAVVSHGEAADHFLISARTGDAEDAVSLFLVPADAAGLTMHPYTGFDGGRAAELELDGVEVPASHLVGPAGGALPIVEEVTGLGLVALCAEALGAMDVAKEMTLEYLRTRKQFGTPIGGFQALQHRMAKLVVEIEQARSAVINAVTSATADWVTRERAFSAAKYTIGRVGAQVAEEAVQMHGGIGMTWELPLSHYVKRLILIDHHLGDVDHHLERYIALGRAA